MKEMITKKTYKALSILREHPGCTANTFAALYFTDPSQESLFTAVSNQGNGAYAGKKAWLCAGSLLGKLAKRGLVRRDYGSATGRFYLTNEGKDKLEHSKSLTNIMEKSITAVKRIINAVIEKDSVPEDEVGQNRQFDKVVTLEKPVEAPSDGVSILGVGLRIVRIDGQEDHKVVHYKVRENLSGDVRWSKVGEPFAFKDEDGILNEIASNIK